MPFSDFINDQRPPSNFKTNTFVENVLPEAFSPSLVKTAAVGILMKMNQLRQSIVQDRSANNTDKSLANMLFLVSSMLATAIGSMGSDPGFVKKATKFR